MRGSFLSSPLAFRTILVVSRYSIFCPTACRIEDHIADSKADFRRKPLRRAVEWVGVWRLLLVGRVHIDLSLRVVVVVPTPHPVEGEVGIKHPSLLETVRVANTQADHHAKASTKTLLPSDELTLATHLLEEVGARHIEELHTYICTDIEALRLALDVETVLVLQNAEVEVLALHTPPRRIYGVYHDRGVWSHDELQLRVDYADTGVERV